MRELVPHFILEQYAQGKSGGRFDAVSLFVDIAGFSAATHTLMQHGHAAAEAMAGIMRALFTPLVAQVRDHGGFITTFAGDAFTALFPLAGEASAYLRALAAAVAIQEHMEAHPVQAMPYGRLPFAVKLGLGDGEVEWGILRPMRETAAPRAQNAAYFFSGPAIEAAAAAEHQAQGGNLVLSQAVYSQVQTVIKALPLAEGRWRYLQGTGELPAPQTSPPLLPLDDAEAAFLPPAVWQHEGSGDFRPVVTVFCQLLGIETRQDLDIFMQAVFHLLAQFDGYLNRVDFGDKGCNLLLFWGMPTSHENDVQRALEFVLELGNHTPGTFRAGLTYRLMYAGLAGSAERGEYTCYGDGVNLAARLMQVAPWGSIWLDERLAGRARRRFVVEYVDHLAFKGWAEKQSVHQLLERRAPDAGFFTGQMVGREQELAQLAGFVQPLFAPAGEQRYAGLLAVVGEAGLGKSRLAHEFLTGTTGPVARAAQVFTCQTDPVLRQPLNPFRYWLQCYFDQSPAQSAERNKRAFSRKLDQVIATVEDAGLRQELERTRSCLGVLVGLEWEHSLYAQLDPQGRYENTLRALKALLKAESLRQPVVLLLEDAHWLDEASQEFLRQLERQIEGYPLAVLVTARPERLGALLGPGYPYRQLDLACLSPEELEELVTARLGGPAAPELLELLGERAESNPFFTEQVLLFLREQGRLVCREGTWGLTSGRDEVPLPDEVRTIFMARLDRLAEEIRALVQAAAILGREFEVRVLAAMLRVEEEGGEAPAELVELVAAAEQEAIWSALTELRYLFKHTLLRDAAYEMQLQVHRRDLHRQAAEALERLYAGDLPPYYGEIAYHYEAACRQGLAEVCPQACYYLGQAGRRAAERYENAAAVDFYSRALALTPAELEEQHMGLLLAREEVYHLLGQREAQWADLQALDALVQAQQRPAEQAELALRKARLANITADCIQAQVQAQAAAATAQVAGAVGLEASARLEWATALWRQGDYPGAQEHSQVELRLAQAAGRPDLQAGGLLMLGTIAWSQGDYAAAHRYYAQALAVFQEIGDRRGEGRALSNLGLATSYQGDYAAARRHGEQALAIRQEIGDRWGESMTFNNLGIVASSQGDYAAARRYFEQTLAIGWEIGDPWGESHALGNLGSVAACQGDYAAARRYNEQALAALQKIGDRKGEGVALNNLGATAASQGDYAVARRRSEQALVVCQEIGDRKGEGEALDNLGFVAHSQGDDAAARRYYEQALAISEELGLPHYMAEGLTGLAQAVLAQGDPTGARAYLLELLPILEANPNLDGADHPRRALLNCGRVLLALGDPRGREILATAHARLQEQAARMEDEATRRMFLENVPEHRELVAEFARMMAEPVAEAGTQPQVPAGPPAQVGKKKQKKAKKKGQKEKKGQGQDPGRGKRNKKGAKAQ